MRNNQVILKQIKTYAITILACLVWIYCLSTCDATKLVAQETKDSELLKQNVYSNVIETEAQDFVRLNTPKLGEWLYQFPESGQSLEEYKAKDSKSQLNSRRRMIVLQPLGVFSDEQRLLLGSLKEYTQAYFQIPTRIAKAMKLPDPSKSTLAKMIPLDQRHNQYDHQYEAIAIVNKLLLPKLPQDAVVYLGITMEDLYAGDLNYVFGFGSFENRTGVYSLARYYPEFWNEAPTEQTKLLTLRRSMKVLNHETSHVFGLKHCIFYDCTMNGSNSLDETDRSSIHECPVCHEKLHWNLKFDPQKRFQSLRDVYTKYGLLDEVTWLSKRSEHWMQTHNQSKAKR